MICNTAAESARALLMFLAPSIVDFDNPPRNIDEIAPQFMAMAEKITADELHKLYNNGDI